jgi:hypothetical protein
MKREIRIQGRRRPLARRHGNAHGQRLAGHCEFISQGRSVIHK